MRGRSYQEIRAEGFSDNARLNRTRGEMHAVASGGKRYVGAVVDKDECPSLSPETRGLTR
jgi:hypothetical protein